MKRVSTIVAAMMLCAAFVPAAMAQTPANIARFNRYLSKHPGMAQRFAGYPGTTAMPSYPTSLPGAQNYSSAYQARYMKNLAKYQNYIATHPGLAANQGIGAVPYQQGYAGQNPYLASTQQFASNPVTALVAPFMPGSAGLQNYQSGYGTNVPQAYQPTNAGSYPAQWGNRDANGFRWRHRHHHRFGGGPYASGAYGRGAYGPYGQASMAQAWNHHHFQGNFGSAGQFNRQGFFRSNTGSTGGWMGRPFASMGRHRMWGHHR